MANPQVLFMGQDLWDFGINHKNLVQDLPDIYEQISFNRDKLVASDFTFRLRNIDGDFSLGNPKSFLNGANWEDSSIQVIDRDSMTIWDAIALDIKCNDREMLAYLKSSHKIYQYNKNPIAYASSDWETAAQAVENIFSQEGITTDYYDNTSLQNSHNQLDSESCYIKCNFNRSDGLTLFQAIEKLGIYSASDFYSHNNKIYFTHYIPYSGGASLSITESDLRSRPIITILRDQIINQYYIGYDGGGESTDSVTTGIGRFSRIKNWGTQLAPEFRSGSTNKQICFKDAISATYIGETYINMTHKDLSTQPKALIQIQFDIAYSFRNYVEIGKYFKFTYSRQEWTNKVFKIYELRRNENRQNINIVGIEA